MNRLALVIFSLIVWAILVGLPGNSEPIQVLSPLLYFASVFLLYGRDGICGVFPITALFAMTFFGAISVLRGANFDGKIVSFFYASIFALSVGQLPRRDKVVVVVVVSLCALFTALLRLPFVDFSRSISLGDDYRMIVGGKHPNYIAYVVAMGCVSLLGFRWDVRLKVMMVVMSLLTVVVTKSKTGLIALLAGIVTVILLSKMRREWRLILNSLLLITLVAGLLGGGKVLAEFYQADDSRSLSDATGRKAGWIYIYDRFWDGNIYQVCFGRGFGASTADVSGYNENVHNAWLMTLYDSGCLGLMLTLLMFAYAFKKNGWSPKNGVLVCAIMEAIAEVNFIGVGNFGSLTFVCALVVCDDGEISQSNTDELVAFRE